MDKETMDFLTLMQESILGEIKNLDKKVDSLDKKVDNLDKRVDGLEKRMDSLEESIKTHAGETLERHKETLNVINDWYEDLRDDMKAITAIQGEQAKDIEKLKRKVS